MNFRDIIFSLDFLFSLTPHLHFCIFPTVLIMLGKVHTNRVYTRGRYAIGPDYKFFKYQADAHFVHLEDVGVFSDGGPDSVGLSFLIDVDFTYFLKEDELGQLHKDYAR